MYFFLRLIVSIMSLFCDTGKSSDSIVKPSENLRGLSRVISVGIGGKELLSDLREMASSPKNTNTFRLDDFRALEAVIENIATVVCFGTRDGLVEIP